MTNKLAEIVDDGIATADDIIRFIDEHPELSRVVGTAILYDISCGLLAEAQARDSDELAGETAETATVRYHAAGRLLSSAVRDYTRHLSLTEGF